MAGLLRAAARAASGDVIGIYWKMSTDLSRPLIAATGLNDVLDGFVTFREVQDVVLKTHTKTSDGDLSAAIMSISSLCRRRDWGTSDPLGIGGLLFDACRLSLLPRWHGDDRLIKEIAIACEHGVTALLASRLLTRPTSQRLAFREIGLAIGLKAIPTILALNEHPARAGVGIPKRLHFATHCTRATCWPRRGLPISCASAMPSVAADIARIIKPILHHNARSIFKWVGYSRYWRPKFPYRISRALR
jgi:hypothetical protein